MKNRADELEELLSYAERLNELSVPELIDEARQVGGQSREVLLLTVLAKRLESYLLAEKLRAAMHMQPVGDAV